MALFQAFDHLAIAVPDTALALTIWRDQFGFPVVYSEVINGGKVRLTHLEMGNTHLQLVQPLAPVHPLHLWLANNGPGLHHFCLRVADVSAAQAMLEKTGLAGANAPHQGTQGKRALFLNSGRTQGVQVEITGS
jgi:methylmalonyl-CoA/ethylmalonyl-CoA epimerase